MRRHPRKPLPDYVATMLRYAIERFPEADRRHFPCELTDPSSRFYASALNRRCRMTRHHTTGRPRSLVHPGLLLEVTPEGVTPIPRSRAASVRFPWRVREPDGCIVFQFQ